MPGKSQEETQPNTAQPRRRNSWFPEPRVCGSRPRRVRPAVILALGALSLVPCPEPVSDTGSSWQGPGKESGASCWNLPCIHPEHPGGPHTPGQPRLREAAPAPRAGQQAKPSRPQCLLPPPRPPRPPRRVTTPIHRRGDSGSKGASAPKSQQSSSSSHTTWSQDVPPRAPFPWLWVFFPSSDYEVKWSHSVVSSTLQPHGLNSPWNSPGQNTGVGSLSLLQRMCPIQG